MIYFITALNLEKDRARCFGYVEDKATAFYLLARNHWDINEAGYYPEAVVEWIGQGIHPIPEERWFFHWDQAANGYVLSDCEPPEAHDTISFAF